MVIAFLRRVVPDPALKGLGHRITQPAHRQVAIATWHRCARIWVNSRFAELQVTSWKPAEKTERVVRFGRR